jgi:hypothetical protein
MYNASLQTNLGFLFLYYCKINQDVLSRMRSAKEERMRE